MNGLINPDAGLLFMKVGLHAGESFGDILLRKRKEYQDAGMIFWGYGGGTCHPTRCVQPFSKIRVAEGKDVYIVMEEINSRHPPTTVIATEYSEDGLVWKPMPRGIQVRGSRYAVVLEDLQEGDLTIDLANYKVGIGPSMGAGAADYIRGRVDKACLLPEAGGSIGDPSSVKRVHHFAKLKQPYAVFTR